LFLQSFQQFNRILAVLSAMENKQQKLFESLIKNEVMRLFEQSLKYQFSNKETKQYS